RACGGRQDRVAAVRRRTRHGRGAAGPAGDRARRRRGGSPRVPRRGSRWRVVGRGGGAAGGEPAGARGGRRAARVRQRRGRSPERDGVTIAISTDGRAPALAGLLREALDAFLPREIDAWLRASDEARREWREQRVPMESRRPQLLALLNALYASKSQLPTSNSQGTPVAAVALVG